MYDKERILDQTTRKYSPNEYKPYSITRSLQNNYKNKKGKIRQDDGTYSKYYPNVLGMNDIPVYDQHMSQAMYDSYKNNNDTRDWERMYKKGNYNR